MVAVDVDRLREEVQAKYCEVASNPDKGFHFHTGYRLAEMLGYPRDWVAAIPEAVVKSFAGAGNYYALGQPAPGATVLDVGCGAGFDSFIAARMVAPQGRVIGVDMTEVMLAKARYFAEEQGLSNVEFRYGLAEALPVEDASVDVVISNGVLNLVPDKEAAYRELFRVLKPGGTILIADVVTQKPVPPEAQEDIDLWTGWIAGSLLVAEYLQVVEAAGFVDLRTGDLVDVFSGAPHESDAKDFEARGMAFTARKPG